MSAGARARPNVEVLHTAARALRQAWGAHPRLIGGMSLAALIRSVLPAASALVIRELINVAVDDTTTTLTPLLPWLLVGLGITAAEALAGLWHQYLGRRLTDDLDLSITSRILEHASRLDVACFEDLRFQDTLDRARQNTAGHYSKFLTHGLASLTQVLKALSLVAVLATIEPLALLVLVPLALPHLFFQWRLSRQHYLVVHGNATKRRWTGYFVSLLTSRRSVPEVKLLDLAKPLIARFRSLMTEFRDQNKDRYVRGLAFDTAFAILSTCGFYAMFAHVFGKYLQGTLLIGDVVIFGTVGLQLRGALAGVVHSVSQALEHALYITNLRAFLNTKARLKPAGRRTPATAQGRIVFRDVTFTYPGCAAPTLRNVSLEIAPGETVAVVGRNGAGKTTLAKLIARFYDPEEGAVSLDGIDLPELDVDYLRSQIAFIAHNFACYEASAADNIAYGAWTRLADDPGKIEEIATRAGVHGLIEGMPRKYETPLGRMFGEYDLSSGQWQQLAIARAFAREAGVMILDEPTSNLDAIAEQEILARFRELARGRTTVLVSHRFSTVLTADRILVMDGGQVVETGTHRELLDRGGHYAMLVESQRKQLVSASARFRDALDRRTTGDGAP